MNETKWLAEGWRELGQREIRGTRHNSRISAFIREVGHPKHDQDETPWCAAFVGAFLERAGLPSTRSLMARSYLKWGRPVNSDVMGAVAVLTRGSNPAHGHVGFLVGADEERIWLLGGNQSNSVSVSSFPRKRLIGYRLPLDGSRPSNDVFAIALQHVLKMEGGYTNDPVDPGGPTNKGITLSVFARFKGVRIGSRNRSALISELKSIDDALVSRIYRKDYWEKAKCKHMAPAVALMHFDAAVNHGVTGAARILQEAVDVAVDGEIGPETMAGVRRMPILDLIRAYARIREGKYRSMGHFWRFGRGWLRRVENTVEAAEGLATSQKVSGKQATTARPSDREREQVEMSREHGDGALVKPSVELKWWGRSVTVWVAVITAVATVLPTFGPLIGLDVSEAVVRELGDEVVRVGQALAGLIGTVMTIYGRMRADQPLKLLRA
ncbi:MAG: TIGR02594 family protein [Pseudomonadota bacterium]